MNNDSEKSAEAHDNVNRTNAANDFSLLDDDIHDVPEEKHTRRWPWLILLILFAVVGGGYYWIRKSKAVPPPAYNTAEITRGDITQMITANGQITPVKTVTVGSQVSGMITELMADYNSRVTNGQIIAQLDPSTYQQSLVQAEADLANANAVMGLAQENYNRAKALHDSSVNPLSELETTDAQLKQAQATVKSREAALNKAKVDLERTTIYSPIDGLVISRAVDVGQTVAASLNAPTLFTIAKDLREMRIEAAVSEADVGGVKEGQSVRFTVDAFPNNTFNGKVLQLRYEPKTNQNVVSYVTVVSLRNDDLRLRPGMTANASIITAQRENVLRVPDSALRFRPPETSVGSNKPEVSQPSPQSSSGTTQGTNSRGTNAGGGEQRRNFAGRPARDDNSGAQTKTVYVMGANAAAPLEARTIKTGVSDGTWTEVLEGLKEGDVVVTGTKQPFVKGAAPAASNPFGGGGMRGPR